MKTTMAIPLLVVTIILTAHSVYGQPETPKEKIPADMLEGDRKLMEKLYSTDPRERSVAAYQLGILGEEVAPATPFLIEILLGDEDANVRNSAAGALAQIKDARAVEALITALKDKHWGVRRNAVKALANIKDKRAVEPLVVTLKDANAKVRLASVIALGQINDKRAVKPLINAFKDKDRQVRIHSVKALGQIKDSGAVEHLFAVFTGPDLSASGCAINGLKMIGTPSAEVLIDALKDEQKEIRYEAILALGEIKDNRAVEPLIELLNDQNWDIRTAAALALGEVGDSRAVKSLISALKDESLEVNRDAAIALGKIGDCRAVEPLLALIDHKADNVVMAAIYGLGDLRDENTIETLLQKCDKGEKKIWLITALGKMGKPAIKHLCAIMTDEKTRPNERDVAATALGKIQDPSAIETLLKFLFDKETGRANSYVARALGEIGDTRAVEPLIAALKLKKKKKPPYPVQACIAKSLGKIKDSRAIEVLIDTIRDGIWEVPTTATKALINIGEPAVEPLLAALNDKDMKTRGYAAIALGEMKITRAAKPIFALLSNKYWNVRRNATMGLDFMGWEPADTDQLVTYLIAKQDWKKLARVGTPAVEALIAALKSDTIDFNIEGIRCQIAKTLGEIGDARAVDVLISCLDKHAWIRKNAITALKKIGTPAVEPLITALKSENKEIKGYAASILGEIKDHRAIEPLIGLLGDKDPAVIRTASRALNTITGANLGEDQKKWQEWWNENKEKFQTDE